MTTNEQFVMKVVSCKSNIPIPCDPHKICFYGLVNKVKICKVYAITKSLCLVVL